ncbi:MAG: hypothetical protein ACKO0Z_14750 [Betaproteobacteria bacterium]
MKGLHADADIWDFPEEKTQAKQGASVYLTGAVLDSAEDDMAEKMGKSDAMAVALQWVEDGEYTYDALDNLVYGMAIDDPEADEPEVDEEAYTEMLNGVAGALVELGASKDGIVSFLQDEDDEAGEIIGNKLSAVMDSVTDDDFTLISRYSVGGMVLDAMEKVVRDGEVTWIQKKPKRKRILSAAQKAALKKARMKANTASAKAKRKKSARVRKSSGLK